MKEINGRDDAAKSSLVWDDEPDIDERKFTILPLRRPIEDNDVDNKSCCFDKRDRRLIAGSVAI